MPIQPGSRARTRLLVVSETRSVFGITFFLSPRLQTSGRPTETHPCPVSLNESFETFWTSHCRFFAPSQAQSRDPRATCIVAAERSKLSSLTNSLSCCLCRIMFRTRIPFPLGVSPDWPTPPEFNQLMMKIITLVRSKVLFECGRG